MANNDEIPLSAIDGVTPESARRRDRHPAVPSKADLETSLGRLLRDARDQRARSLVAHGAQTDTGGEENRMLDVWSTS